MSRNPQSIELRRPTPVYALTLPSVSQRWIDLTETSLLEFRVMMCTTSPPVEWILTPPLVTLSGIILGS